MGKLGEWFLRDGVWHLVAFIAVDHIVSACRLHQPLDPSNALLFGDYPDQDAV